MEEIEEDHVPDADELYTVSVVVTGGHYLHVRSQRHTAGAYPC